LSQSQREKEIKRERMERDKGRGRERETEIIEDHPAFPPALSVAARPLPQPWARRCPFQRRASAKSPI
jgi:hypothetical protein